MSREPHPNPKKDPRYCCRDCDGAPKLQHRRARGKWRTFLKSVTKSGVRGG